MLEPHSREFHVLNTITGQDTLFATIPDNNTLYSGQLDHAGDKLAAVEVFSDSQLALWNVPAHDQSFTLLIYPSTTLYENPYEIGVPTWSLDDKFIVFDSCTSEQQCGNFVVEVSNPANKKFFSLGMDQADGEDRAFPLVTPLQWTQDDKLIFQRGGSLYLYDPQASTTVLFSASSTDAFVL